MDYQEYFSRMHQQKIGFYIYDGGHEYEDQLKGLKVAEPYFSDNCMILVDDTNWKDPRQATSILCKTVPHQYKLLLDRKT